MKQFNYIFLIILSLNVTGYDRITGLEFASRSEVIATNGMAATSHPLATQTAISILKNGGNAIDAAIAANAVLGLVEPTGCGIGGDLFAIIWSADEKKLFGLNSSGPAPKNISINKLKQKGLEKIPPYGPLPVTVPGAVAGWVSIHKKFGLLEFNELFKDGAVLANKRIIMKTGTKKPDVKQQMTALKKNAGGMVTIRTLNYISKLISIIESKHSKAYIKNKPTSLLFQYTSSIIYEGDIEKDIRWTDVTKFWDLPSGEYFTVDSFSKGKDN